MKEYLLARSTSLKFTSRPIRRIPVIQAIIASQATEKPDTSKICWLGWGRKQSGQKAQEKALGDGDDFLLLEDGFIRSIEREDPSLSVVVDDLGMYYDAHAPSRLEQLVATPLTPSEHARATNIIQLWRQHRVSKYNASAEYTGQFPDKYVLVIDQVAGDSSIQFGLANANSFQQALESALREHPDAQVLVKVHPDAFTRSSYGNFDLNDINNHPRIQVINEPCHPVELIRHSDQVYVVTSQIGFEALIWDKKVTCFGTPFYSGWGLTDDRGEKPARDRSSAVTIQQLVIAALVKYGLYSHPETGQLCEIEQIIEWVGLQRQQREKLRFADNLAYAIGFSRWKKTFVRQFLTGYTVNFKRHKEQCPKDAIAVVWGSKEAPPECKQVLRIEDGFLRSSGLGADLVRPLSWVIDDMGIYYDATRPSRLEHILATSDWSESEQERAEKLRQSIIKGKLSKYNLLGRHWQPPANLDKKIILVPGQVPTDASIKLGCQTISSNSELLYTVRRKNPDSYILYKPHPDIVAGLRLKDNNWKELSGQYDEMVIDVDGMGLLEQVDEVHTMTSLMGFEALIRNKKVFCYGQPFYSGWGLTYDYSQNPRRSRTLSIQQLCAGTLIDYPVYLNKNSLTYTTPENTLTALYQWRNAGPTQMPLWRKCLRLILGINKK